MVVRSFFGLLARVVKVMFGCWEQPGCNVACHMSLAERSPIGMFFFSLWEGVVSLAFRVFFLLQFSLIFGLFCFCLSGAWSIVVFPHESTFVLLREAQLCFSRESANVLPQKVK